MTSGLSHKITAARHICYISMILAMLFTLLTPTVVSAKGSISETVDIKIFAKQSFHGSPNGGGPQGQPFTGQQFGEITGELSAPDDSARKFAVVIGSNYIGSEADESYFPTVPPFGLELRFAEADAEAMAGLFTYVYGFDTVIPLIGEDASRDNILATIDTVSRQAKNNDEIVIFYSGHGAQMTRNWQASGGSGAHLGNASSFSMVNEGIVCDEGDGNEVAFIWDTELQKAFNKLKTKRVVYIFDCCLAGGLNEIAKPGNIVAMATTKGGISMEYDTYGGQDIYHGLFTFFMYLALAGAVPEADSFDHDGDPDVPDITVEEAFNFASYSLIELSPIIVEALEAIFGEEIASQWGTPEIVDWFWRKELAL